MKAGGGTSAARTPGTDWRQPRNEIVPTIMTERMRVTTSQVFHPERGTT
jgi:hypothetical protein